MSRVKRPGGLDLLTAGNGGRCHNISAVACVWTLPVSRYQFTRTWGMGRIISRHEALRQSSDDGQARKPVSKAHLPGRVEVARNNPMLLQILIKVPVPRSYARPEAAWRRLLLTPALDLLSKTLKLAARHAPARGEID